MGDGWSPMKDLTNSTLNRAEFLVVASAVVFVAVFGAVAAYIGLDSVLTHVAGLDVGVLFGLLALSLANYGLRALRWQLYSRHLGLRVRLSRTVLFYVAGFAMATTPGKIGEAIRLWLLQRAEGYRYQRIAPLFIGDRVSDFNAALLLTLVGVLAFAEYAWATVGSAVAMLMLTVAMLRATWLCRFTHAVYGVIGRWPRLFAGISTAFRHSARLFDPSIYTATLALALIGWLAECVAFYWLLSELGADPGLLEAMFIFAFSMLVGALSMLPGGLGGTEATMFGLLTLAGTEPEVALTATVIIRVTTLWFAVLLGFVALPLALRQAGNRISATSPVDVHQ
jgi:uncharacterized protein (TIRG00374 family)